MTPPPALIDPLTSSASTTSTTGSGAATRFTRLELAVNSPLTKMVLGKGAPDSYSGFTAYSANHIWLSSGEVEASSSSEEGSGAASTETKEGLLAQSGGRMWLQTEIASSGIYGLAKEELVINGGTGVLLMGQGGISIVAGLGPEEITPVTPKSSTKDNFTSVDPPSAVTSYSKKMGDVSKGFTILDTLMAAGLTALSLGLTRQDAGKWTDWGRWNYAAAFAGSAANFFGAFGNVWGLSGASGSKFPGANLYGEAGLFISTPVAATIWGAAGLLQQGLFMETVGMLGTTVFGMIDASILSLGPVMMEAKTCTVAARNDTTISARTGKVEVLAKQIQLGTPTIKNGDVAWVLQPTTHTEISAFTEIEVGKPELPLMQSPREISLQSPGSVTVEGPEIKIECEMQAVRAAVQAWAATVNANPASGVKIGGPTTSLELVQNQAVAKMGSTSIELKSEAGASSLKAGAAAVTVNPFEKSFKCNGTGFKFK